MNDIKVKLIINVELTDFDVIARIENICTELLITPEEFIPNAINKLLHKIQFVRDLRNYSKTSR
ncbi:hypothetical protein [Clostridium omnivorum]|uniref:Uncharacterized protein n=1 Tax=Clostridium omnivorum TaxID=1604902 RepID=A0ABQ5N392_9CLOT|nr:hypothetical protein [Clostridium sp. E14]GLC29651.1 hypothetical protein bsdE14_10610 [Clostridium sp. E14]